MPTILNQEEAAITSLSRRFAHIEIRIVKETYATAFRELSQGATVNDHVYVLAERRAREVLTAYKHVE